MIHVYKVLLQNLVENPLSSLRELENSLSSIPRS